MQRERTRLSELHLRLLVKGFVELRLRAKEFRIVGSENYGDHWRVRIRYRKDSMSHGHEFAINHEGRLIWERDFESSLME